MWKCPVNDESEQFYVFLCKILMNKLLVLWIFNLHLCASENTWFSSLFERHFIIHYVTFPRDGSRRPPDFQSASSELTVTAFPSDSVCSAGAPWRLKAAWHERVREEGSDSAQQRVCGMQSGAAWDRRQHWLLALPGGGRHPASEPEHWHTNVNPLRPLESLFSGRWVTWMMRLLGDFLFLGYIHLQLFI